MNTPAPPARASGWRPLAMLAALLGLAVLVPATVLLRSPSRPSPDRGDPAPDLSLRLRDGSALTLGSLGDRVVVLHFCGSWNPECVNDAQVLADARARYSEAAVAFVDVLVDDDFVRSAQVYRRATWPVTTDPGRRTARAYSVHGVPQTFFIDRRRRVNAHFIGPLAGATVDGQLELLLGS